MNQPAAPSFVAVVFFWTIATGLGAAITGLAEAGALVYGVVPCALLQGLLLWRWSRRVGWRWLLGTAVCGLPGALVGLLAGFALGSSGTMVDPFAVGAGGLITGAAMGLGGWLALWSGGRAGWWWVGLSAAAWAIGAGVTRAVLLQIDPHGLQLYQSALDGGLPSLAASWLVGARSGGMVGLLAGAISAPGVALLLHGNRRVESSSSRMDAAAAP